MYYNTNYLGMHFFWWVIWIIVLFWLFALPYNIPGQRFKKDSPLHILKIRLALGEITIEEYLSLKKNIEMN
jgi:putative membrane protein